MDTGRWKMKYNIQCTRWTMEAVIWESCLLYSALSSSHLPSDNVTIFDKARNYQFNISFSNLKRSCIWSLQTDLVTVKQRYWWEDIWDQQAVCSNLRKVIKSHNIAWLRKKTSPKVGRLPQRNMKKMQWTKLSTVQCSKGIWKYKIQCVQRTNFNNSNNVANVQWYLNYCKQVA